MQENNQLYQDNRIETFRQIYIQLKMKVRKPSCKNDARFRGSERRDIIDRTASLCRITLIILEPFKA
jgi:hypothetical protein